MQMSRTFKWVVVAGIIEMTLVAVAVAMQWEPRPDMALSPEGIRRRFWIVTGGMAFFPAWVGLGAWLMVRKLNRKGLTPAPDARRHQEISLMCAVALAVGVQAWLAAMALGLVPKGEVGLRLVEAVTGVFIMVAGNFGAKTSPPSGDRAPDPAAWSRGMLRIGWCGVIAGFVILIAAITAPLAAMTWVILGSTAVYLLATLWQHRVMRRRTA